MDLRANTAVDVLIGPFVDKTDGNTTEDALTLTAAEIKLSKNGQALTLKNDVTSAAFDDDGYYNCELDTTDTDTEGNLVLIVHQSANALPVRHEYDVLSEAAWDSLYAAKDTGFMDVNVKALGDGTQSATDLKDFADAGYDPATNKVTGVLLVDTLTTYTNDTPQSADNDTKIATIVTATITNAQGADVATDVAAMIDGNNRVDVGSWGGVAVSTGVGGDGLPASIALADRNAYLVESLKGGHTWQGNHFYVDPVNGDTHANGNRGGRTDPYLTLQDCHDNAVTDSNHDVIFLVAGHASTATTHTIAGTTTFSKRYLTVRGPGRDFIITRTGAGDTLAITADGVSLSGFQLGTAATGAGHGVKITDADFAKVDHVWILDTQGDGVHILRGSNCIITHSTFAGTGVGGSGQGVHVVGTAGVSTNNRISANVFSETAGDSILIEQGTTNDTLIRGNLIHDSGGWAINIGGSSTDAIIHANVFGNNSSGNITDAGTTTVKHHNRDWLSATTEGRTLDITATGAAGIDWGNVENKATANDLSATDIQLCDTVTSNTDVRGTDNAATATNLATLQTSVDGVPTNAEFEARTIVAASYFDPTADTVATVTDVTNQVTTAQINAEVDTALNTAIPGTPTANSVNQRLVAIDALTEASGDGDLASVKTTVEAGATAANLATLDTTVGTAGAGLTDLGGMSTAMKAEVLVEVNAAFDTAISELAVAAPSATPSVRNGIMLMYMALRNKLVVQTSGTDAIEIYNDAGTKICAKTITDDGSDYTEAECA